MVDPGEDRLVLLYVPCGSEEEALRIGQALLQQELIACGNIYQSRSLYRWKGALADETEHLLLCKTVSWLADTAQQEIERLHSYQIPCIIRLQPVEANPDYVHWVVGEVRSRASNAEPLRHTELPGSAERSGD